ncbi:MAG: hypothetical protein RRA92_11000, partial [Gemmatimonadota bacterium]|nr:hypothetical protein [Gemmatimonadota bacterium]
ASSEGYLRVGVRAVLRNDRFLFEADSAARASPPDSFRAWAGVFAELREERFAVREYLNGFSEEDVDLGRRLNVSVNLAPDAFGYERDGVGLRLGGSVAGRLGGGVMWRLAAAANGLFNAGGLDSGRVVAVAGAAVQPTERQALIVRIEGGLLDDPAPSGEFDLGFEVGPRLFDPHSFVGTRAAWGTAEYRWFAWDDLLDLAGVGFAAFLDYGGAWFGDQDVRTGGNVGLGLRLGATRASVARTTRIDVGYRFGPDVTGDRWAVSIGSAVQLF